MCEFISGALIEVNREKIDMFLLSNLTSRERTSNLCLVSRVVGVIEVEHTVSISNNFILLSDLHCSRNRLDGLAA